MLFTFQTLSIVAHSLTFAFAQSTIPSSNNSDIAHPLSHRDVNATTSYADPHVEFSCVNGGTGDLVTRPPVTECTKALFQMPQYADTGVFTRDELPISFQYGTCEITIWMVYGVLTEVTSWDRIGLDATRVVFACDGSTEMRSMGRTGAQVTTGALRGIVIHVHSPNDLPSLIEPDEDTTRMTNGSSAV